MKVSGEWLNRAQPVFELLENAGHAVFAVGGCVRNSLLGAPTTDIDLATDALPERVMDLARDAGIKAIPTGIDHGTVTLRVADDSYEVTTFRRDVATDGRRAVVAFSSDIGEDAARRDFTMNALYADKTGTVIDPLGGLQDLKERRVRFIGQAEDRLAEDALRSLRFFRFHAWYGAMDAGIDADALAAIAASVETLDALSSERVGAEMKKLLSASDPAPAVSSMAAAGVLLRVMRGAEPGALAPLVVVEEGAPPRWVRRALAMGGDTSRFALSKADAKSLEDRRQAMQLYRVAEAGYRYGADAAIDAALVRAAMGVLDPTAEAEAKRGADAIFPIKANDLMPPFTPGPALGLALKMSEQAWIDSGFVKTPEELKAIAIKTL